MKRRHKTTLCVCAMASVFFVRTVSFDPSYAQTASQNWANNPQNWRNSPQNWQNNPQNWQNSSQNWKNNPQNWQNNPNNYNSSNGIYDRNGNRIGYGVPTPNGGVNYFNNDGRRTGFQPGQ